MLIGKSKSDAEFPNIPIFSLNLNTFIDTLLYYSNPVLRYLFNGLMRAHHRLLSWGAIWALNGRYMSRKKKIKKPLRPHN